MLTYFEGSIPTSNTNPKFYMQPVVLKAMGFESLNALVVDHLYWSGTSICASLKRLGIHSEYATSAEMAKVLMDSGRIIGEEGYGIIIAETALLVSSSAKMKIPLEVNVVADITRDDIASDAKPEIVPVGPAVAGYARECGGNPFVIGHYDGSEEKGLWTHENPCNCLITRNQATGYDVLEKILKERFGG